MRTREKARIYRDFLKGASCVELADWVGYKTGKYTKCLDIEAILREGRDGRYDNMCNIGR